MKKIISLLLLATLSNFVSGQTNYEKFKKLFKEKNSDTAKIKTLLADWEKENANDPELYTAAFNFYFTRSQKEIISLNKKHSSDNGFQLKDSSGAVAGYMNSTINYDHEQLEKAFYYINRGIKLFPDRLDIRFGKTYVLQQTKDYENFTKEILGIIEYSKTNKNNWLWTENKKLEDAENFMLGAFQTYLKELYETEDDQLLGNMKRIGDAVISIYPANIEILSTTAVAYLLTDDFEKAIGYLKQAEKLNPKDYIVLNNIARAYEMKGDKENAIKYYELTDKYGDEQAKKQAQKKIKQLKN